MPTKTGLGLRGHLTGIVLTFFFIFASFSFPIAADQTAFEKAELDYTFQFSKYRDLHEKYISSKSAYASFKTLESKNDAYLSTRDYLISVDNLYDSYLLLFKEAGNGIDWIDQDRHLNSNKLIDEEITFLKGHQDKINAAKSLEDLPALSKILNEHLEGVTKPRVKKILGIYYISQSQENNQKFLSLVSTFNDKINVKLEKENPLLVNWDLEIRKTTNDVASLIQKANKELVKSEGDKLGDENLFNIIRSTKSADEGLGKSIKLFEEVLRVL